MSCTVFYSWQSDRHTREGRNFIENALQTAVAKIAGDVKVEEAVRGGLTLDKDTKDVPGSPPIFQTILAKIDRAGVFVADLTFCGDRCGGRLTPNPNVLIEYGWALKSLGYFQVITVMNEAHGKPSRESLPFDLAHLRFPITYTLPDDAPDATRQLQREELAKKLERALREVLESEEFKAKLPKEPGPPPFLGREPLDGKARFRPPQKPLGFVRDTVAYMVGSPTNVPIYLAEGPALWLRLMPVFNPGRTWLSQQELKPLMLGLCSLPMLRTTRSFGFLQGDDGGGYYTVFDNDKTYSVAYVFSTGEMWIIDAWHARVQKYVELSEASFTRTLDGCAAFLSRLGCATPYKWVVGMEGVEGRQLVIPSLPHKTFGVCLADLIENEGTYKDGDKAEDLLRPFFEKVFDQCGVRRPGSL